MRAVDKPLPGDLVIRPRADQTESHPRTIFVITSWPDADRIVAGPYQSFGYALRQARERQGDPSKYIWRDISRHGEPERLEDVTSDD